MAMRLVSVIVVGVIAGAILLMVHSRHSAVHASGPRVPVLVELFTSEGCSSCPPADELLARLDRDQSIEGADVIVLGEHVDYWDRLGWKDRFSSPAFTQRQTAYAEQLRLDSAYTPQAVVNGRTELVASDSGKLRRAVTDNAHAPQVQIALSQSGDKVTLHAQPVNGASTRLFFAVTQAGATTEVKSGENGGHTLHHAPAVLQLTEMGAISERGFDREIAIDPALIDRSGLRAVAFAQDVRTLWIVGAAQIAIRSDRGKLNGE